MSENDRIARELKRGEELFAQGEIDTARECFLRLVTGALPSKEAYNNLGVIAFRKECFDEAMRYFREALVIDPEYEDAAANYRELLAAMKRMISEIRGTEGMSHNTAVPRSNAPLTEPRPGTFPHDRRVRIAVLCLPGLESFLGDIVAFLAHHYDVRTCYSKDGNQLTAAVEWADLVWLEWANELAATLSHRGGLLDGKQVICRVHSYEVLDGHLPRIDWSKITKAVFVAPHVLDTARRIYPKLMDETEVVVIPNGVNLDRFAFGERSPGFNVAVVGQVNGKKNPSLWPEILHRLVGIDDRYTLKIAGAVQEMRYGLYLEHTAKQLGLEKQVRLFGHVENIARWFESERINYLLTTSVFESFGYGIAEAMAMGYRPLINHFPGADGLWPEECLFASLEEAVAMIQDKDNYQSDNYRRFVEERYGLEQQLASIRTAIEEMRKNARGTNDSPANAPLAARSEPKPTPGHLINGAADVKKAALNEQRNGKPATQVTDGYSTDNALGLALKKEEGIRDYMDLHHVLLSKTRPFSEHELLSRLQTSFHRMINAYCNSRTVPQNEVSAATMLTETLCRDREWGNPLGTTFSLGSLCELFAFLKAHLPESRDRKTIPLTPGAGARAGVSEGSPTSTLYQALYNAFSDLYEKGLISSFIVHGSMATGDYTPFSDVDTQFFLTDKAFKTPAIIASVAETVSTANRILGAFDSLQHHGYFASTDLDRQWYPEAFLPLSTMACGVSILGNTEQGFSTRGSEYENRFSLWHTGYFFRTSYINRSFPRTPFDMKRFLSRFSLLPVLYLELFHDLYPYKRDAYAMAAPYFDERLWSVFDRVSRVREKWNPSRLMKFNDTFYRNVFDIAEIMLERLREVDSGTEKY